MDLLDCTIDKSAVNGCDHSEDAGVICSGMCVYLHSIIIHIMYILCVCARACVAVCVSLCVYVHCL
jgi:hypothetical protein